MRVGARVGVGVRVGVRGNAYLSRERVDIAQLFNEARFQLMDVGVNM